MVAVSKLSTRTQVLATVGVMLTLFLAALDQTIVSTALPRIVADLNGFEIYAWVTTAYMVASVVVVPVAGKLGDMFGPVFGLASVVGPTLGGYLTDNLTWRWVFYVNVPVGIVALAVVLIALPYVRSAASWREIDFPGVLTLAAGVIPLLIGLTITSDHAWTSPAVLGFLAVGVVMLVVFFVVETRFAANPIVPFE